METASPYLLQPGEAELRWMGETSTYFLATGAETAGAFTLVDERARRRMSVPLHRHPDDVESFYVLEGEVMFFLGEKAGVRAGAGAFAHVPGGTLHGFRAESDSARYLILTTPHHGEFYRFDDFGPGYATHTGGALPVSLGGSSEFAYASGGAHADIFALWGEPLAETAEQIDRVYAHARAAGRTDRIRF